MSENLNKILMIDQNIQEFIVDNEDLSDLEFEDKFYQKRYIDKAISILKKINSKDMIEVIKRCRCLWHFVDFRRFVKKYPLNKTFLRKSSLIFFSKKSKVMTKKISTIIVGVVAKNNSYLSKRAFSK